MKIRFQTKEQSNQLQREAFLKLSPTERVQHFFRLMYYVKDYPTKKLDNKNFKIVIDASSLGK